MFNNTSDSKYQLVGVGDLVHPASCLGCGNGNCAEGYINLAVSYDWEGQMYLCWTCLVECAEIIGCMIPAEVEQLKQAAFETSEQNASLRAELDVANERLAAYDVVLRGAGVSLTPTGDLVGVPVTKVNETTRSPSVSGEPEITGEQPESTESTQGSGSDNTGEPEQPNNSGKSGLRLQI